jgi:hypothetical protein
MKPSVCRPLTGLARVARLVNLPETRKPSSRPPDPAPCANSPVVPPTIVLA